MLYADDTTIFLVGRSLKFLRAKMQSDLHNLCTWLRVHKLKLNVAKSKAMLLNNEGLLLRVDLYVNGQLLEVVKCFKFLGITLDISLDFGEHYGLLHSKLLKAVFIIRKLVRTLPLSCLRTLYFSYYHANLTYCAIVWLPLLRAPEQNALFLLQKQLVRTLSNAHIRQHCMPLYKKHNILMLKDQLILENVKLMHRIVNKNCPIALENLFGNQTNGYNTRNSNVIIPKHQSVKLNKSFVCKSYVDWSRIKADTKNIENVKLFAKHVKKAIIETY